MEHQLIIVFDGVCNFCESSMNFVIHRDKNSKFKFAPAQSDAGEKLQKQYGINAIDLETMILIKDGVAFTKSDAAVEIAKDLDGAWRLLSLIRVFPKFIRDWAYSIVGQNRYRVWGKKETCMVPTADIRARFLN